MTAADLSSKFNKRGVSCLYAFAINGLGLTGRSFLRSAYAQQADIEVVAINDLADAKTITHRQP